MSDRKGVVTYEEWEASVPAEIREDPLWSVEAYRLALFLSDLVWNDLAALMRDRRTIGTADQVFRAAGSISANIAEGWSRSTAKDHARFFEYALGSSRETRDWYFKGRHVLKKTVVNHRVELSTRLVRLTTTMTANEHRTARRIAPRSK